jgi:hypothetical protein
VIGRPVVILMDAVEPERDRNAVDRVVKVVRAEKNRLVSLVVVFIVVGQLKMVCVVCEALGDR